MKGLIRNNFYSIEGSFKITLALSVVMIIAVAIGAILFPHNDFFIQAAIAIQIFSYVGLIANALQQDIKYKWSRFEITMPVSRKNVVKARYLSCLLYSVVGIVMAMLTVIVFYLITSTINLERVSYGFTSGIVFALLVPSFMYPINLILGDGKSDITFVLSIGISMGLFVGSSVFLSTYLESLDNANLIFRVSWIIISMIIFMLSYLFSVLWYSKKEL